MLLNNSTIANKICHDKNNININNLFILLIGESNTGKTSIAFNIAYDIALHLGTPLFICNQAKIERFYSYTFI